MRPAPSIRRRRCAQMSSRASDQADDHRIFVLASGIRSYLRAHASNGFGLSWYREDDLTESLVGFEASMSILDLVELKDRVYHGLHCFLGQQRYNLVRECAGGCDLFLQRSRAHHRADDVETFAQNLIEIDIRLTAGDATD